MPMIFGANKVSSDPQSDVCLRIISDFPSLKDGENGYVLSCTNGRIIRHMIRQAGFSNKLDCIEYITLLEGCDNWDSFRSKLKQTSDASVASRKFGAIDTGRYLNDVQLVEAKTKLAACKATPATMTIVLGDLASKAWFGESSFKLKPNRGAVSNSKAGKVLATYHPRIVMKDWKLYSTVLMDIVKATTEATDAAFNPPKGKMHLCESVDDVRFAMSKLAEAPAIALDIETVPIAETVQIDCIGFSPNEHECYVVLLFDRFKLGKRTASSLASAVSGEAPTIYAGEFTVDEEVEVWGLIDNLLQLDIDFVMQNGIYDTWIMLFVYGLRCPGWHDTMVAQHVMFTELPKGLDYLGSIYTNRAPWKQGRQFGKKGE